MFYNRLWLFLLVLSIFIIVSCHIFDNPPEDTRVNMFFEQTSIGVYVDQQAMAVLKIEPPDGLEKYSIEFSIINPNYATIFSSTRNSVVIVGRQQGQTLLTARAGGNTAETIINVSHY